LERFNLKKVNAVEGKEHYRVNISNKFAALEIIDASAWKTNRDNINISAKVCIGYNELKVYKTWSDE
jgi:hypothetical protein